MNLVSTQGRGAPHPLQINASSSIAAVLICTAFTFVCVLGCGMAASPQPPSLQLPKPVRDLAVARTGNRVTLHWTSPTETTDRLKIKLPVQMRICRQSSAAPCETVATIATAPAKPTDYADLLPANLTAGPLHAITYTVFALNKHGRSAGPSNAARTLAGKAPPVVQAFTASMTESGVVLRWQPVADLQPDTFVRLQRTLLNPQNSNRKTTTGLPPASEPVGQTLQVTLVGSKDPGTALDSSALFDRKYRYMAQRIVELQVGTVQLQLASAPSAPAIVSTRDTFPPGAPTALAAVPVSAAINGGKPEVDLSWSPNAEPDLAQYLVYRRDAGTETSSAKSAANAPASQQMALESPGPIVAPAFRDVQVQAGHTYAYSVIAVDNAGNRSRPSGEVIVTVPGS